MLETEEVRLRPLRGLRRDSLRTNAAREVAGPKGQPSLRSPKASEGWRRERDSNPRTPFEVNGFQDRSHGAI